MLTKAEELIVKKGKDHVWQNPRKDKQSIVQMARISPRNGYNKYGKVHWDVVETPTMDGYYHFYQLGDNYPGDFTLIAKKNQWYRLSEWCEVIDLVIHIYDSKGRLYPLRDAYTIRLYNDNLIIAVKRNDIISDINEEKMYIHFYRNYFYTTIEKDPQQAHIKYLTNTHSSKTPTNSVINLNQLARDVNGVGRFRLLKNGLLVESFTDEKLNEDDVIELHYDMSVRKIVDFPLADLRTFKSDLDKLNKYLLHPPKEDIDVIDYRDDLDIFVCKRDKKTKEVTGIYYHRNMENSVRMVTHRDWSLPVPYVMACIETLDKNADLNDFFIRVYVRKNGNDKKVYDDANMIKSLYKLPDSKIVEAMTMVDSVLPEWKASHLENSAHTALMRSYRREITPALALDAFGYSTSASILAYPNIMITLDPNGNHFKLPPGLQSKTTIYEYDRYGTLLGWYHHDGRKKYYPENTDCIFIEALAGEGGNKLNFQLGKVHNILPNTAYRFYSAKLTKLQEYGLYSHELKSPWQDVTHDSRIRLEGNVINFDYNEELETVISLGDNLFLTYDKMLDHYDGILDFRLTMTGDSESDPMVIPMGKIDIWLNGRSLIEGIDYYINFPDVIIVNKKYLDYESKHQKVTVRCLGFPFQHDGYLKRIEPTDVGFVQYGEISVNNRYDIHEDKIMRVVVHGGTYMPDVLPYDEKGSVVVEKFTKDGSPYSIEQHYISMPGTLGISLYLNQIKDFELTKRVSDYLTLHAKKEKPRLPPVIRDKYEVYSPFLSKIATDIKYGRFKSLLHTVSIDTIDKAIKQYKRLLPLDPVIRGYNEHFVNVHAHNLNDTMELTPRDIAFLERLNDIYLKSKVDVSKFFKVRKGK